MTNYNYNIHRPTTLEEIVGQKYILEVLRSMLKKRDFFPVILITGPKGTGKTSLARIIAKYVNCDYYVQNIETPYVPCNKCENCQMIKEGNSLDILEIDGATYTGVDATRLLLESAYHLPHRLNKKIIIIDEVHMLSKGAFNSMLKTLETPPSHVIFFLITTEINKIPDTILSRTMILRTSLLQFNEILEYLIKISNNKFSREIYELIANHSKGSLREALVNLQFVANMDIPSIDILRKCLNTCNKKDIGEIYNLILLGNCEEAILKWEKLEQYGVIPSNFFYDLLEHIAQLMIQTANKGDTGLSMNLLVRHWELIVYQMKIGTLDKYIVPVSLVMLCTVVENNSNHELLEDMYNTHPNKKWVESIKFT